MFNWVIAFAIFIAYISVDVLYAWYTVAVINTQPLRAATTASSIYLLLALGIINYTNNLWYVIPAALGSWVGTYTAVEYSRRQKHNDSR